MGMAQQWLHLWKPSGICVSDCTTWKDTFGVNADIQTSHINWNIPQHKLKVSHILPGDTPHRLTPLQACHHAAITLDIALFFSVYRCISFHFSLTIAVVAILKSYPAFAPLFLSLVLSPLLPLTLNLMVKLANWGEMISMQGLGIKLHCQLCKGTIRCIVPGGFNEVLFCSYLSFSQKVLFFL